MVWAFVSSRTLLFPITQTTKEFYWPKLSRSIPFGASVLTSMIQHPLSQLWGQNRLRIVAKVCLTQIDSLCRCILTTSKSPYPSPRRSSDRTASALTHFRPQAIPTRSKSHRPIPLLRDRQTFQPARNPCAQPLFSMTNRVPSERNVAVFHAAASSFVAHG